MRPNQFLFTLLATIVSVTPALAKRDKEQQPPQVSAAPTEAQQMSELNTRIVANFNQLTSMMATRDYQGAMTLAKQTLDEARLKVGIDPKSREREIIVVPDGTFSSSHRTMGMRLNSFPISVQNSIIREIAKNKSGYYLDLLNLLKRTNLIYIQAFHNVTKASGLMQEDVRKIRSNLNQVRAIPIYVREAKSTVPLLIFDFEVANEDQNYFFNRELKMYLMAQGADLGYAPAELEAAADRDLESKVSSIVQSYISSESQGSSNPQQSSMQPVGRTMLPWETPIYLACYEYAYKDMSLGTARSYCVNAEASGYDFRRPNFKACWTEFYKDRSSNSAIAQCLEYAKR